MPKNEKRVIVVESCGRCPENQECTLLHRKPHNMILMHTGCPHLKASDFVLKSDALNEIGKIQCDQEIKTVAQACVVLCDRIDALTMIKEREKSCEK